MRLGQAEATNSTARAHCRQPSLPLNIIAKLSYAAHDQAALHRNKASQTTIAALELSVHDPVGNMAQSRAPGRLECATEHSEISELAGELAGEPMLVKGVTNNGYNALVNEAAHGRADHAFLVTERRLNIEEIQWVKFHALYAVVP